MALLITEGLCRSSRTFVVVTLQAPEIWWLTWLPDEGVVAIIARLDGYCCVAVAMWGGVPLSLGRLLEGAAVEKTVVIFLERDSKGGVNCAHCLIIICTKKAWKPMKSVVLVLASCEECWLHVEDCSTWVQIAEEGILVAILVFVCNYIWFWVREEIYIFAWCFYKFLVVKTATIIVHLLPGLEGHWM
ncbi:hypothetical protein V8G54_021241 [Vigna mungo]|uniref:Transmembrane protein n=1 Tax=Vigna mungo TaxID=3915 RepID=A0AAQ3NDM4_VIGMU